MKRPDLEMIRAFAKKRKEWGYADESIIKNAVNLPFFYLADKELSEQPHVTSEKASNFNSIMRSSVLDSGLRSNSTLFHSHAGNYRTDDLLNLEHVYDEYVMSQKFEADVHLEDGRTIVPAIIEQWGIIRFLGKTPGVNQVYECTMLLRQNNPEGFVGLNVDVIVDCHIHVENNVGDVDVKIVAKPQYEAMLKRIGKYSQDTNVKTLDQVQNFWQGAQWLMLYLKYGPKHPVEVSPSKKVKSSPTLQKNRPWVGATGPRVLLLDRMPATQSEGTGTHASPKPHRRRGHWKTLSHPRFRHHPQYQKKIYVKPSFVGPRQVSYEGNIYRLVETLEGAEL
jgi:hypothetical protein